MIGGTLFFIILCFAVGFYASTLGRNFIGWTLASAVITPFLASIVLLIIGNPGTEKS